MNDLYETFWQACVAKDAAFDGKFILAVRTTGIYCRPSCPARKPRRENVLFFRLPALARQAGFRPCKRCNPDGRLAEDPQVALVSAICRHIEAHPDQALTLEALSAEFHLSPAHLQRTFKEFTGISPQEYTEACRLGRLKQALRHGAAVSEAIYTAGYSSSSRVYEKANAELGMTPRRYQRQGAGMQIRYTIIPCALGLILVGSSARGICAVRLGDQAAEMEATFQAEYAGAELIRDDQAHQAWVQQILAYLAGEEPHLALPLDVRATAFQRRVWQALQEIPFGETRSYSQIAVQIGQPAAVRAVANACAANPAALVIPCHRVTRHDGSLGGYRWGLSRKQKLLEMEAAIPFPA